MLIRKRDICSIDELGYEYVVTNKKRGDQRTRRYLKGRYNICPDKKGKKEGYYYTLNVFSDQSFFIFHSDILLFIIFSNTIPAEPITPASSPRREGMIFTLLKSSLNDLLEASLIASWIYISHAPVRPPARTIASGLITLIMLAIPIPRFFPASFSISLARMSPSRAVL